MSVPATAASAADCSPAGGADGSPPISQIQTDDAPYDRTVSASRLDPYAADAHDVVFSGGGWGHGVGLSQWAAQGAASLGCSATQIIQTHFPNSTIDTRTPRTSLRLKLWTLGASGVNSVWVKSDTTWRVCQQNGDGSIASCDGRIKQPAGTSVTVRLTSTGWRFSGAIDRTVGDRTHTVLQLRHDGQLVRVQSGTGASANAGLRVEYGRFELDYTGSNGGRLFATQIIGNRSASGLSAMGTYLLGLAEVPFSWHQHALRAQVMAARSYAEALARIRESYEDPERIDALDCRCDLRVDTGDQVWAGATKRYTERAEHWQAWVDAVRATKDRYVIHDGRVLQTFYSSSFGGVSRKGFYSGTAPADAPYASVDVSRWEQATGHSRYRWSQGFSREELQRAFGIDDIDDIRVVSTDGAGYPMPRSIEVTGVDNGQDVTKIFDPYGYGQVRSLLGLYSPRFVIHEITDLADDTQIPVARLSGETRALTAIQLSQDGWSKGSDTVVLAREDNPADALTGSALAGTHGAPLLLTRQDRLSPEVATELERLDADRVLLLGGDAALSTRVANDVRALGIQVVRVQGATRHGTAVDVARRVDRGDQSTAYLVKLYDPQVAARGWADALSVSAVAARRASDGVGWPILGTENRLPAETREAIEDLGITRVVPIGGTATIPDKVLAQLAEMGVEVADRLAGEDRYGTSRAITATDTPTTQSLVIATGENFPDGLAAGPYTARTGGALLLVPTLLDRTGSPWQAGQHPAAIAGLGWDDPSLVAVGGPVAISAPVISHTANLLE